MARRHGMRDEIRSPTHGFLDATASHESLRPMVPRSHKLELSASTGIDSRAPRRSLSMDRSTPLDRLDSQGHLRPFSFEKERQMRDDFTEETRRAIASRAGWRCSNPG